MLLAKQNAAFWRPFFYLHLSLLAMGLLPGTQTSLISQFQESRFFVSLDYGQGQTLRHRPSMVFDLPNPARDYRLEISQVVDGSEAWHKPYHFPIVGAGILLLDYGNPDVLGRTFSTYFFVDHNYLSVGRLSLFGRFEKGIAFHSKAFDPETNPLNNAIGSNINLHASLGLGLRIRVYRRAILRIGGYFSHQSNSRFSFPNLGLNTVKVLVGANIFSFGERSITRRQAPKDFDFPTWHKMVSFGLGIKEEKRVEGPRYPVYMLRFQMARNIKNKRRIIGGIEAKWDLAKAAFARNQGIDDPMVEFQSFDPSISLGHEYLMGHVGLLTQANLRLKEPFQGNNYWSVKVGSNVYVHSNYRHPKSNLFVGIYINANKAVADFLEFAVGYQF